MATYKADIEIGVRGIQQLQAATKQITTLSTWVDSLNKRLGTATQSINKYNTNLANASQLLSKVNAGTIAEVDAVKLYVTALGQANAARDRQNKLISSEIALRERAARIAALPPAQPAPGQFAGQFVGPKAARGTRLAAGLQQAGMPTFAGGIRQAGRTGIPGAGMLGGGISGAIISAAFPLLTGQGVESAIGGGIGGLVGGVLGSVIPGVGTGMGSFAGGLVGSIIGERKGEAEKLTEELQRQLRLNQGVEASERALLDLKLQIASAQTKNNDELAIELERRKANKEVALELFKTSMELEKEKRGKTKEEKALLDLEMQRLYTTSQRVVQENNAVAVLQQQKREMQQQVDSARHLSALNIGQLGIERQRVSATANYVQARSQAEIAVNQVILDRLNSELQSATTAQERLNIAQQIYNVEVANAQATYAATVAQIQAQVQLVELAAREQEIKLVQLQVEQALLAAKGQQNEEIARAIQLQTQAVQLASENVGFANQTAAEQLRGADATLQAAIQAAALKQEINGAAESAAAYANNMQAGAIATQAAAQAVTEMVPDLKRIVGIHDGSGTLGGLIPFNFAGPNFQSTRDGRPAGEIARTLQLQASESARSALIKSVMESYSASNETGSTVAPQVNITTGPVMQMDGTNYVTQSDLTNATQSAARQGADMALTSLRSNPSTRRSVGLAR